MSRYLWWEKTVEYFYIKKYLEEYSFVCPLDGDHEKASDSLLSNLYSWIVIEFKKDKDWLPAERKKFSKGVYEEAKGFFTKNYNNKDGMLHHSIVYGSVNDNGDLELKCQKYFSVPESNISLPDNLLSSGLSHSMFSKYIEEFIEFKSRGNGGVPLKPTKPSNPDIPPGIWLNEFQTVVGICAAEKKIVFMTIQQFSELNTSDVNGSDPEMVSNAATEDAPEAVLG